MTRLFSPQAQTLWNTTVFLPNFQFKQITLQKALLLFFTGGRELLWGLKDVSK